jgi:hypothetical protein
MLLVILSSFLTAISRGLRFVNAKDFPYRR